MAAVGLSTPVIFAEVVWLTVTVARGELGTGDQLTRRPLLFVILESEGAYWSVRAIRCHPVAPDLVTTAEEARERGVSRHTLLRYVDRGYLMPTVVLPTRHVPCVA